MKVDLIVDIYCFCDVKDNWKSLVILYLCRLEQNYPDQNWEVHEVSVHLPVVFCILPQDRCWRKILVGASPEVANTELERTTWCDWREIIITGGKRTGRSHDTAARYIQTLVYPCTPCLPWRQGYGNGNHPKTGGPRRYSNNIALFPGFKQQSVCRNMISFKASWWMRICCTATAGTLHIKG